MDWHVERRCTAGGGRGEAFDRDDLGDERGRDLQADAGSRSQTLRACICAFCSKIKYLNGAGSEGTEPQMRHFSTQVSGECLEARRVSHNGVLSEIRSEFWTGCET